MHCDKSYVKSKPGVRGLQGLEEIHQTHSKILFQTEAKCHFVYFINFMQVKE